MIRKHYKFLALLGILISTACFAACLRTESYRVKHADTHDEVGGVHVAVLSVSDWNSSRRELQPKFELKETDALKEVVPTTMLLERMVRDLFAAKLKLSPPQSLVTATETVTEATGEEPKTTKQTERKEQPGDISKITAGTPAAEGEYEAAISSPEKNVVIDPMLKYDAAAALCQHVELLNRDLLHAAIPTGWEAYVVRIQLSLQPRARCLPYDAYTTLSFFNESPNAALVKDSYGNEVLQFVPGELVIRKELLNTKTEVENEIQSQTAEVEKQRGTLKQHRKELQKAQDEIVNLRSRISQPDAAPDIQLHLDVNETMARSLEAQIRTDSDSLSIAANKLDQKRLKLSQTVARLDAITPELPIVLPLLVTNNMEAAMRTSSVENIRQYGLSLLFMIKGMGGQVDFDKGLKALEKVLGRDYNSLLSVARLTDNSLRVRIGAMQQAESHYATVCRPTVVTLLLLVPTNDKAYPRKVHLVAKTVFVDASEGTEVPARGIKALKREVRAIAYNRGLISEDKDEKEKNIADLFTAAAYVQQNQVDQFMDVLCKINQLDSDKYGELWAELAELKIGGQYDMASFELPLIEEPAINAGEQMALLMDDGANMSATLRGGCGLDPYRMSAILKVKDDCTFVANEITCDETGMVILRFPSPQKWGIQTPFAEGSTDAGASPGNSPNVKPLVVYHQGADSAGIGSFGCRYLYEKAHAKKPIDMFIGVADLIAKDFACPLTVTFTVGDDKEKEFYFHVSPCGTVNIGKSKYIDTAVESDKKAVLTETEDPGKYRIKKSGDVMLSLQDLTPNAKIKLEVKPGKGTPADDLPQAVELLVKTAPDKP